MDVVCVSGVGIEMRSSHVGRDAQRSFASASAGAYVQIAMPLRPYRAKGIQRHGLPDMEGAIHTRQTPTVDLQETKFAANAASVRQTPLPDKHLQFIIPCSDQCLKPQRIRNSECGLGFCHCVVVWPF